MRKSETIAPDTDDEVHLPLRHVALDDDVYYVIKQAHERLGHVGYKKTHEAVCRDVYGINCEEVEWFTDHCRRCEMNKPNQSRAPLLACQAIAEDRDVGNSEKSQYHECVYKSATARSFRSVRYYYCTNANRMPYATTVSHVSLK